MVSKRGTFICKISPAPLCANPYDGKLPTVDLIQGGLSRFQWKANLPNGEKIVRICIENVL